MYIYIYICIYILAKTRQYPLAEWRGICRKGITIKKFDQEIRSRNSIKKFDHEIRSRNSIRISIRIRAISEFPNEGDKISSKISEFPNEGDEISSKTDSISNNCMRVDQISSEFDGISSKFARISSKLDRTASKFEPIGSNLDEIRAILCILIEAVHFDRDVTKFWSNFGPGTKAR